MHYLYKPKQHLLYLDTQTRVWWLKKWLNIHSIFGIPNNKLFHVFCALWKGLLNTSLDWRHTCSSTVPNGETTCATQLVSAAVWLYLRLQTPYFRGGSHCCRPNIPVLVQCVPHTQNGLIKFHNKRAHIFMSKGMLLDYENEKIFFTDTFPDFVCIKSISSHDYNELHGRYWCGGHVTCCVHIWKNFLK